jgi:hypothetical protein
MYVMPKFRVLEKKNHKMIEELKGNNLEAAKSEDKYITNNRPFWKFTVKQVSYEEQYKVISMALGDLKLRTVVGKGAFGTVFLG